MKKLFLLIAFVAGTILSFGTVPENHFRFVSNQDGSNVGLAQISSHQTLEYSLDGVTWGNMTTETTFSLSKDVVLYVRGKLSGNNTETDFTQFAISGSVEAKGNINYIWDHENLDAPLKNACGFKLFHNCVGLISAPEMPATILASECYSGMFYGCTGLKSAPSLPASELTYHCYSSMFRECAALENAPSLPAVVLANNCYVSMFQGCTTLKYTPLLPASETKDYCYYSMFSGCTSLISAPELPATTSAPYCYAYMFYGCTNLSVVHELPATTLATRCYSNMFQNCTALTTAPELPATTLATRCYSTMFAGCTSLISAPELPATTLSDSCYFAMFQGCTNLTQVPALPALTLAFGCYVSMFRLCPNITIAPALPATILAPNCYRGMFYNCSSLEKAPVLPATTLTDSCYRYMFYGCSSLKYVKCLATDISAKFCTLMWLSGVPDDGSFVKNTAMEDWTRSYSGIPTSWTVNSIQPYIINFDANGGLIPRNGDMGITPSYKSTYLSPDQKSGYVIVYSADNTFSQLRNDCPTRAGHTFLGWYTSKTGGTKVYDNAGIYVVGNYWDSNAKWKGTADLQLYAQWSVNSYTITWLQDDGSLIDKTTVPYGQIPTHVAPTKEPTAEYTYTFAGWAPTIVPVTDNATYIATYEAHPIPTALDDVNTDTRATKILRDGQIFILRGDNIYTVDGREVK